MLNSRSSHHPHPAGHRLRSLFRQIPGTLLTLALFALLAAMPAGAAGLFPADGTSLRGQQILAVPEADLEIFLWEEILDDGSATPFAAIAGAEGEPRGRTRVRRFAVELEGLRFDPLTDGEPAVAPALAAGTGNRLHLVQLVVTALPELQELIRETGGKIHRYYTNHTLLVEMDPAVRDQVEALSFVRWVGPYHPAYRLEPFLQQALGADSESLGLGRYSILLTERGRETQEDLAARILRLGGQVDILTDGGFRLEATLAPDQLTALAADDRVQYIDRWGGPAEYDMDIVREVGGADFVEIQTGFTGQGVRGEVIDSECRLTHQEWALPPIVHNPSGVTTGGVLHGTSSTSNVFAQGIDGDSRGVAPSGQPIFFLADEASNFGGSVSRYTSNAELIDPAGPYRAVFQTSSVGNTRTTLYSTLSAETDDYLFLHQILSTQSQSNAGSRNSRPQAWAKNIVSVGGFRHFGTADRSDDRWNFSASIGPAEDGRIKPDLSFFNDGIRAASGSGDTNYTTFGGTSSATPQTAGYFALLFQMWHEGVWAGHGGLADVFDSRPQMITAKALMIHHAHRYDWSVAGPNDDLDRFKQGWGTADARNLYESAAETRIVNEGIPLAPLASYSTTVPVTAGQPEFKATLAYVDPMGTPGAGVHRINDLSLKVTSPTGTVYWGNNGLVAGNASTPDGVSNTVDTVENVFVPNPEGGTWTVEVFADEVVQDSHPETPEVDADFALILSPVAAGDFFFGDDFETGDTSRWSATVSGAP